MTTTDRARRYLAAVPGAGEGDRDNTTIATACKLVEHFDLAEDELAELLIEWNGNANRPPMTEREVSKCLRSALERTSYDPALANGAPAADQPHRRTGRKSTKQPQEAPAKPLPDAEEWQRLRSQLTDGDAEPARQAREYLSQLGIDPKACGWGLGKLTAAQAAAHILPAAAAGVRYLVPVYDALTGALADVRRYAGGPFGKGIDPGAKLLPWAKGTGSAKPYRFGPDTAGAAAIWCEGEKDCEALRAAGFPAVSNTCGAGSARRVAEALPDEALPAEVTILFDADEAGRAGAEHLAAVLAAREVPVSIASWPADVPDGYDVADALADGYTAADLREILETAAPYTPPDEEAAEDDPRHCPPGAHRRDEIGNGGRLVALYGDRMRWCTDWKTWLAYDGTRWAVNTGEAVRSCAKRTARSILREALAAPDDDERSHLAKWAATSATRKHIESMLFMAQPDLAVESPTLDADPDLLNCRNGTIDLRTGELLPHDPDRLMTRRAEAEYHPGADLADTPEAETWQQFLTDATGGDEELTSYLQRAAGYTLTGNPNEEVLFFAYGPTRTGKSTFLETCRTILADYADSVDFGALLRKREGSDARPEIAKLQGKRLAVAVEASGRRDFEAELIKWLTGGDTISARALHANPTSWRPAFTLWLAANNRPKVDHDDTAIWARLRVVPLTHQIPKAQIDAFKQQHDGHDLKTLLREQCADVILAWLVRGCLEWRRVGLGTCAAVQEATGQYREAMDPLGDWLADCCAIDTGRDWFTPTAVLFESYRKWAEATGEKAELTQKQLGEELTAKGLVGKRRRIDRGNPRPGYDGIRLTVQGAFDFDSDAESSRSADTTLHTVQGNDQPIEPSVQGVQGSAIENLETDSLKGTIPHHPTHPTHPAHPEDEETDSDPFTLEADEDGRGW